MKRLLVIGLVAAAVLSATWLLWPWGRTRRPGERRTLERLKSLPYAEWTRVAKQNELARGVVLYDRERAWRGVNLYSSETEPGALLLDMNGEVLLYLEDRRDEARPWKLVQAARGDRFVALANDGTILMVDEHSKVLWERRRTFHHDFTFTDDDVLYAIDRRLRRVPELARLKPVRDDHLMAIAADGQTLLDLSSVDLLLSEPELQAVARRQSRPVFDWEVDVFHTNTITPIPRDVVRDGAVLFERGDLLICWRNLNTVAVVDPGGSGERASLRWFWGNGELEWPHHPTLLDDGNLLLFDNGTFRGWSRVVEIDPVSREIVWEYHAEPRESFFSSSRGSAQRLPNGDTLITDSMSGHVFEVTSDGETVWEFYDPRTRSRLGRTQRATIYRMTRLPQWPLPSP